MPYRFIIPVLVLFYVSRPFTTLSQQHSPNPQKRTIAGVVVNDRGDSVSFVSIKVHGTKLGAISDTKGMFAITLESQNTVTLTVRHLSYEFYEQTFALESDTTFVTVQLLSKVVTLKGANVSASAFSSGEAEGVTLKPLEVVTTPGAAADIFRTLQTFPGVASPDEGSMLIVRGGNPNETITLIDQASVAAPYRAQAPNGGTFGFIPPFFVSGTFFSSGGMPARYGNALSGVVALESLGMPAGTQINASLSTGGASLGAATELAPGVLGMRISGNYTNTDLLFRLNGTRELFTQPPVAYDANLALLWRYSSTGKIKIFSFASQNGLETLFGFGSEAERFQTAQTNGIVNLQITDVFDGWLTKLSLSGNIVRLRIAQNAFSMHSDLLNLKSRTDIEKDLSDWVRVLTGTEVEYDDLTSGKSLMQNSTILDTFIARQDAVRIGGYAEVEWKVTRNIVAGLGMRTDIQTNAARIVSLRAIRPTFDPRISLKYVISPEFNVRAAWGIFHQYARPDQLDTTMGGNPSLEAQQATHTILGSEYQSGETHLRFEAYNKMYAHLILPSKDGFSLTNSGYGYARGVDFFAKHGEYLKTDVNGWISYSLLETKRLQARRTASTILYEEGATPFDIRHNIVIVGKARVWEGLSFGIAVRYSSGRAITTIVGGVQRNQGRFSWYEPIDGPIGSERLPDQMRLDIDVSYFLPIANNAFIVLFASLSNATGRPNILGYTYSADYSHREPNISLNRQFIFAGATATVRL
ncbi:MAG: TonB-dependent receptor [Bacteroidota bacterium]|nr:TonB-dependent receptor [Candidatus Kapabacteria bacterium]MDW8220034.1 TonB-dependent receptor [Bacteroidota bacterium]